MTEPQHSEPGTERIGQVIGNRWTLVRVLGSGGMAMVYEGQDASGQRAAVKVLHRDLAMDAETRSRFEREVAVTAQIDHPGIVRVLDQRADAQQDAYIAMELLDGETLGAHFVPGQADPSELLDYIDQVLDALARAHDLGVVHRDLKPDNLFVTSVGGVKLLDFGVARLVDPSAGARKTRTGLALGTAAYMAPEQALGKRDEIDARTDLFAVGAILFRLLSGRRIHEVNTDGELMAAMATRPAPPFRSVVPNAPPGLASLIDVALGFNRDTRYPDARTMQGDVRAIIEGRPPPFATSSIAASEQATVAPGQGLDAAAIQAHAAAMAGAEAPRAEATVAPRTGAAPARKEKSGTPDLVGQVVAGRYRIEALLGAGGMGSVFRAEHVHMRKAVAFKVLHREMTFVPEIVARFEREAIAAARIEHANVAAATDFGKLDDGSFYLALEYIEGESLADLLHREPALSPERATRIARQIASALAAAHAADIVHRDLKPDNVMLVERGDKPDFVKVLDFGIAKVTAEDMKGQPALTQLGSVFGTPEYMSPEQAMGQPVDKRTDLYSLGVICHEMLSGAGTPFGGDDMIATLTAQMTRPPPPLPDSVPAELAAIVMRLLAKRPDERFPSADDVVAALDQLSVTAALPAAGPASVVGAPMSVAVGYGDTVYSTASPGLAAPLSTGTPLSVAQPASSIAEPPAATSPLQQQIQIGRYVVPVWMLGAAAAAALLAGLLFLLIVVSLFRSGGSRVAGEAERGDEAAIEELAERSDAEKTAEDWRAQGRGLTKLGKYEEAVAAHAKAIRKEPALGVDPGVLADLRQLAVQPESWKAAQDLAADLGPSGADLLYDVWVELKSDPAKPGMAKEARARLDRSEDRSESLQIALDLETGTTCASYKVLMPRAVEHADVRSLPKLEALSKPATCGGSGSGVSGVFKKLSGKNKQDCWACLRGDDQLTQAVERARSHPAPSFEMDAPNE